MKRWFNRFQKHLILWAGLFVYLFSANQLYIHLILKNGKPIAENLSLPAETQQAVNFKLADMQPVQYQGEFLYQIKGFAFLQKNPEQKNKIMLVLRSTDGNLVFPTIPADYPNMIQSYPKYKKGMEQAEFRALLSKNVLKPGKYQVGLLIEEGGGTNRYYVQAEGSILTTYNTIKYTAPKQ